MTYYDFTLKLSLFRFVANVHDLQCDNFFVLTMNRRGFIRIYFLQAKMMPQAYTGLE